MAKKKATAAATKTATKKAAPKAEAKTVKKKAAKKEVAPKAEAKTVKKKAAKKKAAKKRTSRVDAAHPRLKAFWAVCNPSLTVVSMYEYSERKEADQQAEKLTKSKSAPHFVQVVKRTIEE